MRMVSKRCCGPLAILFVLSLFSVYFSPRTHADGGAPNLAYVSGTSSGISVIDVGQAKVTKTMAVAGDPHTILLSQDGGFLYVSQPRIGQVSVIKAKTGQTLCNAHLPGEPTLLTLDTDTNTLFAAGNGAAQVNALDPTNCVIQHTFQTTSPVYGLAVALTAGSSLSGGTTNQLWVAGTDSLTVFDDQTGKTLGSVPLPDGPQYLSIPPGKTVYVTTRQGSVDAVDLKTREVRQILRGGIFGSMDYDAITGEVYVPDEQHDVLDVLSPVVTTIPKEPNRVIRTENPPEAVAITSDGLLGFIALRGGSVAMLDLLGRRLVYTVTVGGTPHFIITGLYPPLTVDTATPTGSSISPGKSSTPEMFWIIVFCASLVMVVVLASLLALQFRQYRRTGQQRRRGPPE
jgi:DNA-binding beta-propeller fold protein YncE